MLRDLFDRIDILRRGSLTFKEIDNLLNSAGDHHHKFNKVEIESLIRRFNKDKMNGVVSLPEFLSELTPKLSPTVLK